MVELQRSTSKPALMKDSSAGSFPKQSGRHVAFEAPSKNRYSGLSDIDSNIVNRDKRRFNRCCSTFCVWSCLSLFILIIISVFIAISYLILLQGGLPEINVRSLNITKLELDKNSQNLNAAIGLGIRITNKNEKTVILYGPLSVDVISEDVPLGNAKVGRFSQEAQNETNLDLKMTMNNVMVDKDAVDSLKSDIDAKEMVFDVYVGGYIGFKIRSMQMTNVPFLSSCHEIKQMDVDFGRRPACDVRMFAFRSATQRFRVQKKEVLIPRPNTTITQRTPLFSFADSYSHRVTVLMADEAHNDLKEEVPEVVPFDPTKKKKKKKITIVDPADDSVDKLAEKTENLSVTEGAESTFAGLKKKKKKQVEISNLNDESGDATEDLDALDPAEEEEGDTAPLQPRYPWEGSDRDYEYEELLGRVFNILRENNPELAGDRRRTVMRPPQVLREGTKKTVFVNFMDLCKTMHRQPDHVMAFLLAELGTSGSLDGQQRLVVKGRFAPKNFEGILRRYINEYVICLGCKSPDTILSKENRLFFLRCEKCGSGRSVAPIKAGFVARVGRRNAGT
ncbi:unnamed protein product [Lupinus luteus]|uniref:Eukaryotic translation initiation factor 2 subunit beta n=1 Tax=Lupinus luteus TaxID=3873 RepID=A0AAV1YL75_LUPLU